MDSSPPFELEIDLVCYSMARHGMVWYDMVGTYGMISGNNT